MHYTNRYPNIVRNWEQSQGITNTTDLSYQIIRDYNLRNVSVQNSSQSDVTVGFTTYPVGPKPNIYFTLSPGETKEIGINSQGSPVQWIWLMNPYTHGLLGDPQVLHRVANTMVIRGGLNKFFIQYFNHPSYYAAK